MQVVRRLGGILGVLLVTLAAPGPAGAGEDLGGRGETLRRRQVFDQLRQEHRRSGTRTPLREFLAARGVATPPRADYGSCLESGRFPLSVCYGQVAERPFAAKILAAAEEAWQRQVVELGFRAPSTNANFEPIRTGLDIYVDATAAPRPPYTVGGYVQSYEENPLTAHRDCLSFMMINAFGSQDRVDVAELGLLVHHEFHHAVQAATDCSEGGFSLEAGAQWMQAHFGPTDALTVGPTTLGKYQGAPGRPLVWYSQGTLYQYGGFLFFQYLQEAEAAGDVGFVRQLWEGTVQPQAQAENEPDLLDALEAAQSSRGRSLTDVWMGFGEWRFFVGRDDDGKHFQQAASYTEVARTRLEVSSVAQAPVKLPGVYELGYAYLELNGLPANAADDLRILVDCSDPEVGWGATVYALEGKTTLAKLPAAKGTEGGLEVRLSGPTVKAADRLLVLVGNHGRPGLDMDDDASFRSATFIVTVRSEPGVRPDAGAITAEDAAGTPDVASGVDSASALDATSPEDARVGAADAAQQGSADAGLATGPAGPETGGCGCGSGSGLIWPVGGLLAMALSWRRRSS